VENEAGRVMDNSIQGFTFYRSYYDSMKELSDEDKKEMIYAILDFVFKDIEPTFTGIKKMAWQLIKPNLNTSKNRSNNGSIKSNEIKKNQMKSKTNHSKSNKSNNLSEKDKEEKKELDEELDKEKDNDNNLLLTTIINYVEKNWGRTISPVEYEKATYWLSLFEKDKLEIVIKAVQIATICNKRNFNYVNGILINWKTNNYKSLIEIEDSEVRKASKVTNQELFDYNWLEDNDD